MFDFNGIRFGFFCSTANGKITTNRKFRVSNLSFQKVWETFERNLEDFKKLLQLSKELGCGIFRLGSDFIPFASHPNFPMEWLKIIEKRLLEFSEELKSYPIRITMHPGQFVVLNSPKEEVIMSSLRELKYHFWLLDTLGIGSDGVVVIHGGGVYGDKEKSLRRLKDTISNNAWLIDRIALENDERYYTVADLIEVTDLGIPIVYDHYHHTLNPSYFEPMEIIKSWGGRTPEFHLSSEPERKHRFGEHGDWVKLENFLEFYEIFKGQRIDLILEAKKKEKAIEKLLKEIKRLTCQ